MANYGEDLFKGTARYYSKYRPIYPSFLIRFLIDQFKMNGKGRMLDLGCGTGQLTFRFTDWFEEIIAIDTDPEMLLEAKRLSNEYRVENVKFINKTLEDYQVRANDRFTFVTIAKAFHWLNREATLETLYDMLPDQGGVAIIDHYSPNEEQLPWQTKLSEVVREWYGNERRAGNSTYVHPTLSHQDIVINSRFELEVHQLPVYEHIWSIETIIGHLYSTSYGAQRFLGENKTMFEKHLTEELLAIDETGVFKENMNLTVILAMKNMRNRE
ncbi:class I SAM-dependent methyltransferase [Alkalicoccobacillus gibsonii]|uniref:class I SAM-dependent methyltransferase n=1 Tax=Alkalicoccobacillus gibsonii TaxID=79881 RepID=UPI0019321512|nr:class I SAM-dependent methyltransferase [Alkalicoccobacillus gibsonii]MBM0066800.1 class I SAM-dependent methyltransferase [Alkalicoccobacillus gibsonii]